MKKLKLNLDEIKVESFEVSSEKKAIGTVLGEGSGIVTYCCTEATDWCNVCGGDTMATCAPTCNNTCNVSAPAIVCDCNLTYGGECTVYPGCIPSQWLTCGPTCVGREYIPGC